MRFSRFSADSQFSWVLQVKMVKNSFVFDSAHHNPIIRANYDTSWTQGVPANDVIVL